MYKNFLTLQVFSTNLVVDSWGKIPSAIFGGRFIWPGDMKQCQDVKGNRVLVVNDSTTVLEKDGIKGAWGMAYFSLPASLGLQGNPVSVKKTKF